MDTHRHDDGRHDFDFWFGHWNVRNERLKHRLAGSSDWEHFPATQACQPILGGLGNIDDYISEWNRGGEERFVGMTLRLFDPATRNWSLYWSSNRTGVLEPPMVGRFDGDVGTFIGKDVHEGRPVLARFIWTRIARDSARWEQALSADDGGSWETNWIMHMSRVAA